jgi:hypothetical protein
LIIPTWILDLRTKLKPWTLYQSTYIIVGSFKQDQGHEDWVDTTFTCPHGESMGIQSPCSSMASSNQQNKAFLVLSPPHADQSVIWCERTRDDTIKESDHHRHRSTSVGEEWHGLWFWLLAGRRAPFFFWTGMCHMWGARDSLEALKPHHKSDKGKDVIN